MKWLLITIRNQSEPRRRQLVRAGFTLLELVVGMASLMLVLAGVFHFWYHSVQAQQYNTEAAANTQAGRAVIMAVSDEIRNAVIIATPVAATPANRFTYQKSGNSNICAIYVGSGADANTLLLDDGSTIRRLGQGRVESIVFTRDSAQPRKVTVALQLKSIRGESAAGMLSVVAFTLN